MPSESAYLLRDILQQMKSEQYARDNARGQAENRKIAQSRIRQWAKEADEEEAEFERWRAANRLAYDEFWRKEEEECKKDRKISKQINAEVSECTNNIYTDKLDAFMSSLLDRLPKNSEKYREIKALNEDFKQTKENASDIPEIYQFCAKDYISSLENIVHKHRETDGLIGFINLFRETRSYNDLQDLKRDCKAEVDAKSKSISARYGK